MKIIYIAMCCIITNVANSQVSLADPPVVSSQTPKFAIANTRTRISAFSPWRSTTKKFEDASESTKEYNAAFLTTNFTVPILRFNLLNKGSQTTSTGNVALFNSVGAGLAVNFGRLTVTKDANGIVTDQEFATRIGLQVGCLFAASNSSSGSANVFAPTLSLTVINFQIGGGYELGDVDKDHSKFFISLAYGIPLAKLVPGAFWKLWQSTDSTNVQKPNRGAELRML